jgi:hypothetical protein
MKTVAWLAAFFVLIIGLVFGGYCLVVLLLQAVVAGLFGYHLPFWPTMGCIFLVNLFTSGLIYSMKK